MLTCQELKNRIEAKQPLIQPLVLKYKDEDGKFICHQYVEALTQLGGYEKTYIETFQEISDTLLETNPLYILDVEKLAEELPRISNLVVLCQSVDKSVKVESVEIPSLQHWQLEDYVKAKVPGLSEQARMWLCEATQYNPYRLDQECRKLSNFPATTQQSLFDSLYAEGNYQDLSPLTIFNFVTALVKGDQNTLQIILEDLVTHDIEATGVCTLLSRQFKNMIDIQSNPKASPESLGMKPGQFHLFRNLLKNYPPERLRRSFKFVNEVDYKLKSGDLMLVENTDHLTWNNQLVDYLVCNLMVM